MIFDKNREIKIMGIVNLTDDSYYAPSRCPEVNSALKRIEKMIFEGADIIDIGACSTRPGSLPVGAEEEWKRLKPVLEAIRKEYPSAVVSIDTYWSSVVRKAYDLIGSFIVNDISAGEDDSSMLETVGRLGLTYAAMHKRGTPVTMQSLTDYDDVTEEVMSYFAAFSVKAHEAGIDDWIVDPGFGFAKTTDQNWQLARDLAGFKKFGRPLLVGVSRKSMIYKKFSISPEESLPAVQVLHMHSLINGADILRVHDVAEAKRTTEIYRMVQSDDSHA